MKQKELIHGLIYKTQNTSSNKTGFFVGAGTREYIYIRANGEAHYSRQFSDAGEHYDYSVATEEETEWAKACIFAKKHVPRKNIESYQIY